MFLKLLSAPARPDTKTVRVNFITPVSILPGASPSKAGSLSAEHPECVRLRVLIVTHYYSGKGGGIESVAHQLARRFGGNCFVKWAAVDLGDGLPVDVSVEPLRGSNLIERVLNLPWPILSLLSCVRLSNLVRWANIVHIHDSIYLTSQLAFLFARLFGKPVVITQHVGEVPYKSRALSLAMKAGMQILGHRLLRGAECVTFISDVVRRSLSDKVRNIRATTIYNGVDSATFNGGLGERDKIRRSHGLPANAKIILFVGRFVEKKGLHHLKPLVSANPMMQWVFIGRGSLNPRGWNLRNARVYDQMASNELAEWYRAADLLVLPSVGEGLPLVVQEALACGLPCLVTEEVRNACPAASELLLSAGHRAERLAEAFSAVKQQLPFAEPDRAAIAARAQALWDWEKCSNAYRDIFSSIVAHRNSGTRQVADLTVRNATT
jgi:glycosyltransferase involved in cell wall biosynthesis